MGASFVVGALLLRKLLIPGHHSLDTAAKQTAGQASK